MRRPGPRAGVLRTLACGANQSAYDCRHRSAPPGTRISPDQAPIHWTDAQSGWISRPSGTACLWTSRAPKLHSCFLGIPRSHEFDQNLHREHIARDERLLARKGRSAGGGITSGPAKLRAPGAGARPAYPSRTRPRPAAPRRRTRRNRGARRDDVRARVVAAAGPGAALLALRGALLDRPETNGSRYRAPGIR